MPARLAMEEGNRETQALKLRSVRRRLFQEDSCDGTEGRGSGENEANRFMEETRQNLQQAKEKWNFDFEKEEPLPGNYEWVKPDEDFPSDKDVSKETEEKTPKENNENVS